MRRATTPTHSFTCPVDPSTFNKILLTYAQGRKILFEHTKDDLTIDGYTIRYTLTLEEANMLNAREPVKIQIRAKTFTGKLVASQIIERPVGEVLNDGDI